MGCEKNHAFALECASPARQILGPVNSPERGTEFLPSPRLPISPARIRTMRSRTSWGRLFQSSRNQASRPSRKRRTWLPIIEALEDRIQPTSYLVTAADAGSVPRVKVYDAANGHLLFNFLA